MFEAKKPRNQRWIRWISACLALILGALVAFPWIIARSGLRDILINRLINASHLSANSEIASLGWITPASIDHLQLDGEKERLHVAVDRIEATNSWLQMLMNSPDLGEFDIQHPRITINLPLAFTDIPPGQFSPMFRATIQNAELIVCFDDANKTLVDIDRINLSASVEDSNGYRMLVLDPVELFVERELKPDHCSSLLQLLSPSMRYATKADGSYSLSLDKARIPLGVDRETFVKSAEFAGKLSLHQISLESESPLLQALSRFIADLYGLVPPEKTNVVKDATIMFHVRDGRLHHEGLQLGFPNIDPDLTISTRGSVGLDESLDLCMEIPRLDSSKQQERGPVTCFITGTISKPVITASDASLVLHRPGSKETLLEIDGVDLVARIVETEFGRAASFDPFTALNHQNIQRGTLAGILRLIDPGVEISPQLAGEVSLSFDNLQIPLARTGDELVDGIQASGQFSIHEFKSDVSTPLRQAIVKLLADLYGKETSDVVRVVQNATVQFEVRNSRLHFDGLNLGFPDIDPELQIRSSGSVGLDESLDIQLRIPRLDKSKREKGMVLCHVTGTLHKPRMSVQDASLVIHLPDREEPLLDVDSIDFSMSLISTSDGSKAISIDPGTFLNRQKISRRLASGLLHMVDPGIRYSPKLNGEVSLDIERLIIPTNASDLEFLERLEMKGRLSIHDLNSVATSPLRHALVKLIADLNGKHAGDVVRIIHNANVEFEIQDGQVTFSGLEFGFPDISPDIHVKTWGTIGLDESLDLHVLLPRSASKQEGNSKPAECHITGKFSSPKVSVSNASLTVRLHDDLDNNLNVGGIDFQFEIERTGDSAFLSFAPFTILEKQDLTNELSDGLMTLIAPSLAQVADVTGSVSLHLDRLRIPLASRSEIVDNSRMSGKLTLHDLQLVAETPLMKTMLKILFDQYGKPPQESVRVTKNAKINFELKEHRVYHDGFRFGFPEISSELTGTSSGWVGLDQTLDLTLVVPRFVTKGVDVPEVDEGNPVRFRISGTTQDPIVEELKD